ncbi:hypothetical protein DFJ73DRAFT_784462 [Zopfochytrium polystomum]|nr:hypothetical protein DFJ73DRAFT_784462 [Zopfochytrium polystomum]
MHLPNPFPALAAASLLLAALPNAALAAVCGEPRDGLICMSSACGTGNGVHLKTTPLITGIALSNFNLNFPAGQPYALASSTGVRVSVGLPESLSSLYLRFTHVSSTIKVGQPGRAPIGAISVSNVAASGDSATGAVVIDLADAVFAPVAADAETLLAFEQLLQGITLLGGPVPLGMSGVATNGADVSDVMLPGLDSTDVCLENVQFAVNSSLIGLGGLKQTTVTSIPKLQGGNPNTGLQLSVDVQIVNPSTITLQLNTDVTLSLKYNGSTIGTVVLPSFSLGTGTNKYAATGYIHPDPADAAAVTAATTLISRFVAGNSTDVVVGSGKAGNLPALDLALGSLQIAQTLPGSEGTKLLSNTTAYVSSIKLTKAPAPGTGNIYNVKTTMTAANPFDVGVAITGISATVFFQGVQCITINAAFNATDFAIPARGTRFSPYIPSVIPINGAPAACTTTLVLAVYSGKQVQVDVFSQLTIAVGGYVSSFKYNQANVTITPDLKTKVSPT